MYKVLIVDDENIFIEHFVNVIKWEQYGCVICGYANDGPYAIELMKKLRPDIVFMDINMSSMSGLEVCDIVKNWSTSPRIIILTAYGEFEFAKKAIKLGVFDYLLKPVDKQELLEALHKCIEDIQRDNEYEKLQQNKEEGEIEKYLRNVLELGAEDIPEDVIRFEKSDRFLAALIKLNGEKSTLIAQIKNQLETYFGLFNDIKNYIPGIYNGMVIVVHIIKNSEIDIDIIRRRYIDLIIRNQSRILKCDCVSIGNIVFSISHLGQSYQKAIIGMENRIKLKTNVIIFDDIKYLNDTGTMCTEEDVNILIKCFQNRQYKDADIIIEKIFGLSEKQMFNFQYVISVYYSLAVSIYSHFKHEGYKITDFLSTQKQIINDLNTCATTQEAIDIIKNYIHELFSDCMNFYNTDKGSIIVSKIEKYLEQKYNDSDLTVNQISDALFFESSYIRRIYKTHTGKTIIQRLEEIRMNRAKELLCSTNYKHKEIANMVGYSDQFYFSRRFKLITKFTPTEYQNLYS